LLNCEFGFASNAFSSAVAFASLIADVFPVESAKEPEIGTPPSPCALVLYRVEENVPLVFYLTSVT
jgi:hypothetical protein